MGAKKWKYVFTKPFEKGVIACVLLCGIIITACMDLAENVEKPLIKSSKINYSPLTSKSIYILDVENNVSTVLLENGIDSRTRATEICKNEKMICFSGGYFPTFAVPKNLESESTGWTYADVAFKIIKKTSSPISSEILIIESTEGETVTQLFLFDLENGLIGILNMNGMKPITVAEGREAFSVHDYDDVLLSDGPGFGAGAVKIKSTSQ